MLLAIPFPDLDPVLVAIGPFALRWYALAYMAGIVLGWLYLRRAASWAPAILDREKIDDLLLWATLGIVVGGRLGYALFYKPGYFFDHPLEIFMVWKGGMSFHGGLLGIAFVVARAARAGGAPVLALADRVAMVAPIGLFFGRLANFVNAELYGRPSELPWAVVFPGGGPAGRHPSQLYEAALEGLLLLVVLAILGRSATLRARHGFLAGVFLGGYGLARGIAELFREPDAHLGFPWGGLTMGQLLCLPMLAAGLVLVARARARP